MTNNCAVNTNVFKAYQSYNKDGSVDTMSDVNSRYVWPEAINSGLSIKLNINEDNDESTEGNFQLKARINSINSLLKHENKPLKEGLFGGDIFCSRGVLTKIALSTMSHNALNFYCFVRDGVILIFEKHNEYLKDLTMTQLAYASNLRQPAKPDGISLQNRLKNLVSGTIDAKRPTYPVPVKEWAQLRHIRTIDFGEYAENCSIKVTFSCIIDCLDYVTKKACMVVPVKYDEKKEVSIDLNKNKTQRVGLFGVKSGLRTYFNAYFTGVQKLIVGKVDSQMFLKEVKIMDRDEISENSKDLIDGGIAMIKSTFAELVNKASLKQSACLKLYKNETMKKFGIMEVVTPTSMEQVLTAGFMKS
uniref:DUF3480 domain-containing protein n=1 Tax=Rhabditophanes sp. KR3021 TaxID=114890 RepID=A0AC35TU07_9BILA